MALRPWGGPHGCKKFLLSWGALFEKGGRARRGAAMAGRWAGGVCTNQTLSSSSCSEFHWGQWQQARLRRNHGEQCSELLKQWGARRPQGPFHQDHIYLTQEPPQLSTYNQACGLGESPQPFVHLQDPSCFTSLSHTQAPSCSTSLSQDRIRSETAVGFSKVLL